MTVVINLTDSLSIPDTLIATIACHTATPEPPLSSKPFWDTNYDGYDAFAPRKGITLDAQLTIAPLSPARSSSTYW